MPKNDQITNDNRDGVLRSGRRLPHCVKCLFMPPSTRIRQRPRTPGPTFPLTPRNNGKSCKNIRGTVHFFGVWDDPQTALSNYLRVAADLHAGRLPRTTTVSLGGLTVKDVGDHFLTRQFEKVGSNQIAPRSPPGASVADNRVFRQQRSRPPAPGQTSPVTPEGSYLRILALAAAVPSLFALVSELAGHGARNAYLRSSATMPTLFGDGE